MEIYLIVEVLILKKQKLLIESPEQIFSGKHLVNTQNFITQTFCA